MSSKRFFRRWRPLPSAPSPADVAKADAFSSDLALTDALSDEFGRGGFAQRVAEVIEARTAAPAFVIGVYGPWGSGKTTVLRFIENRLKSFDGERFPTIWFNPWRYGSEELLVQGLFDTLADILELSLPRIKDKVGGWLQVAGGATGGLSVSRMGAQAAIGTGLSGVGRLLSQRTLERDRDRLNEALRDSGKRIVVMIDDVDRLDKNEIVTILRAVKLAADFDNLVYVLAFDPAKVAAALADRYPGQTGMDFLDKMVQLPLQLPRVDPIVVRERLLRDIDALLSRHGLAMVEQETWRLASALDRAVLPRVRTARDHTLYLNAVEFAVPAHSAEVNVVDVVLLEALRLFYPAGYEMVSREKTTILSGAEFTTTPESILRERLAEVDEQTPEEARKPLRYLLQALFPQFDSVVANTYHADWEVAAWIRGRRVCTDRYFDRFFTYGLPPGDVAEADIDAIVDGGNSAVTLSALLVRSEPAILIAKLLDRAPHLTPKVALRLIDALAAVAKELPPLRTLTDLAAPRVRAALLTIRLVSRLDAADRSTVLKKLLQQSDIEFATLVQRWIRAASEPGADDPLIASTEVDQIVAVLADRLLDFDRRAPLIDCFPTIAPDMYALVFQSDPDRANKQLAAALTDRTRLVRLLRAFLPADSSAGSEPGGPVALPPLLENQAFAHLGSVIPAAVLLHAATTTTPTTVGDEPDDPILARYTAFVGRSGATGQGNPVSRPLPTITSSAGSHPLANRSATDALAGTDPHNADLAVRIAVLLPALAGAPLPQESPTSRLNEQEREAVLTKILTASPITSWLNDQAEAFNATEVIPWTVTEARGSDFTVLTADLVDSDKRVPVRIKATVATGRGQIRDIPSLLVILDVTFALLDRDEQRRRGEIRYESSPPPAPAALKIPELVDVIDASLGVFDTAWKGSDLLLPPGSQRAAVAISLASRSGLDRVIDVSHLAVLGNGSASQEQLYLYRQLGPASLEQPITDQLSSRDLAVAFVGRTLSNLSRRGFEADLNALRIAN